MWITAILIATLATQEDVVAEARRLVEAGRSLDALQALEEASRTSPDDAAIHHALGALYASAGRSQEALRAVSRAVELAPEDKGYAFALGELLYRSGEAARALPYLERAAEDNEHDALIVLAGVYENVGDRDKLLATLERYVTSSPQDAGARLLYGEQLELGKRFDEAIAVYRGGLELEPDNVVFLHKTADGLSRNRETYGEAETLVRKAISLQPDALESGLLLARLLERQQRFDESLAELERLRGIHPGASRVHFGLATAYQRAGEADQAEEAAERFEELSAFEKEASERKARVAVTYKQAVEHLQSGNMREAEMAFRETLTIDPNHAQTKSMLAKITFSKQDLGGAMRWISEAIENDDAVAEFHYLDALFKVKAGDPDGAVTAAQRSLELDPALAESWSLLGTLLFDGGRPADALECYEKAAALDPGNESVYLNLAAAYAAVGNDEGEEAAMVRYRELSGSR